MENCITPVNSINWANYNIHRAGIIPIYDNKWLGFGINNFSANITVIGGSYECEDYDLLSTAVREYNEEVGSNLEHIIEEKLYNCKAIQSEYSISILYPVTNYCVNFTPTEDLHNIIWISSHQLRIMERNQQFRIFKTNKTKAFTFSIDLKLIASKIIQFMDNYNLQEYRCRSKFIRPKRLEYIVTPEIHKDVKKFIHDAKEFKAWGTTAILATKNKIFIMRGDKTTYILLEQDIPIIIEILYKLHTKFYVSISDDLEHPLIFTLQNKIKISSIENGMNWINKKCIIFLEDVRKLRKSNTMKDKIQELHMILNHEIIIYQHIQKNGMYFNEKRALFLNDLNNVNNLVRIIGPNISMKTIKKKLNIKCICDSHVDLMVNKGLIKYKRSNSTVWIV